jgi:hypothetical protein
MTKLQCLAARLGEMLQTPKAMLVGLQLNLKLAAARR